MKPTATLARRAFNALQSAVVPRSEKPWGLQLAFDLWVIRQLERSVEFWTARADRHAKVAADTSQSEAVRANARDQLASSQIVAGYPLAMAAERHERMGGAK